MQTFASYLAAFVFVVAAVACVGASLYFSVRPGKGTFRWASRLYWLGCACLFFLGGYPMYFLAAEGTGGGLFGLALLVFLCGMVLTVVGISVGVIYRVARRRAAAVAR